MPQPKRQFLPSSLTSTLKSTIASQPLLSNLNEKISSQASSWSQKASPFFGTSQESNTSASNSANSNNVITKQQQSSQQQQPHNFHQQSKPPIASQAPNPSLAIMQRPLAGAPQPATTPSVDMSHLTEEERLKIESVMAKAEMVEMGLPTDSSIPTLSSAGRQQQQQQIFQQQQQQPTTTSQQQASQSSNMQLHNQPQMQSNLSFSDQQQFNQQLQHQHLGQQSMQRQQPQASGLSATNSFNSQMNNQNNTLSNVDSRFQQQQPQPQLGMQMSSGLEQQTAALVSQINSQFGLNQSKKPEQSMQGVNQNLATQQQHQPQPQPQQQHQQLQQQHQQLQQQHQLLQQQHQQPQQPIDQRFNQMQQQHHLQVQQQQQLPFNQVPQQQQTFGGMNEQDVDRMPILNSQTMTASFDSPNALLQQPSNEQRAQQFNRFSAPLNIAMPSLQQQIQINNANQAAMNTGMPLTSTQLLDYSLQDSRLSNVINTIDQPSKQQQQQLLDNLIEVRQQPEVGISPNQQQQQLQAISMQQGQASLVGDLFAGQRFNQDMIFNEDWSSNPNQYAQIQKSPQHNLQNIYDAPEEQQLAIAAGKARAVAQDEFVMQYYETPRQRDTSRYQIVKSTNRQLPVVHSSESQDHYRSRRSPHHHLQHSHQSHKSPQSSSDRRLPTESQMASSKQPANVHRLVRKAEHAIESPSDSPTNRNSDSESGQRCEELSGVRSTQQTAGNDTGSASLAKKQQSEDSGGLPASVERLQASADTTDEALKLLSKLRLTEQANQVLEQQQMLIKQSQELIKLQLEQQALSQELRRSINTPGSVAKSADEASSGAQSEVGMETKARKASGSEDTSAEQPFVTTHKDAASKTGDASKQSVGSNTAAQDGRSTDGAARDKRRTLTGNSTPTPQSKNTQTRRQQQQPSSNELQPTADKLQGLASKWDELDDGEWSLRSDDRKSERVDSDLSYRAAERQPQYQQGGRKVNQQQTGGSSRATRQQAHQAGKFKRNSNQSPTDTTDSDFEPVSVASQLNNSKQQARKTVQASNRSRSLTRRREPSGLPPSPLPVTAAIQLHQMQLQHMKSSAAGATGGSTPSALRSGAGASVAPLSTRVNFLRSRSVTSSPNHYLHYDSHSNSGYVTDTQRQAGIRCMSPDTMSEFGGMQRKRKRLPEPPQNAIPLTPAMVRKMIQTQRAGNQAAPSKLLHSVNIQSTAISNSHAKSCLLDKDTTQLAPRDGFQAARGRQQQRPRPAMSATPSNATSRFYSSVLTSPATAPTIPSTSAAILSSPLHGARTDLSKYTGSADSAANRGTDVGKLISNLDEFYKSDTKHRPPYFNPQMKVSEYPSLDAGFYQTHGGLSSSTATAASLCDEFASTLSPLRSNFGRPYGTRQQSQSTVGLSRRRSEGEATLTARLDGMQQHSSKMADEMTSLNRGPYAQTYSGQSYSSSALQQDRQNLRLQQRTSLQDPYRSYSPSAAALKNTPRVDRHSHQQQRPYAVDYYSQRTYSPYVGFESGIGELSTNARYRSQAVNNPSAEATPTTSYENSLYPSSCTDRYNQAGYKSVMAVESPYGQSRPHIGLLNHKSLDLERPQMLASNPSWNTNQELAESFQQPRQQHFSSPSRGCKNASNELASQYQDKSSHSYSLHRRPEFSTLTKDDILNYGPKYSSIGYRYQTGNANKYVVSSKMSQCLQSNQYPFPYKRLLLCKNPKDRIGNGIGIQIVGGITKMFGRNGLYDNINKCVVTSAAVVTQVFQNSYPYTMDEFREGDLIIEWNGVNLCNRSNEEVDQILLMTSSDDEVEIVFLPADALLVAYSEPNSDSQAMSLNASSRIAGEALTMNDDNFAISNQISSSSYYPSQSPSKTSTRQKFNWSNIEPTMSNLSRRFSLSSIANMWSR